MSRSSRYSPEFRERAVRLLQENQGEYNSQWAAMNAISAKVGCTAETLRKWVRRAEIDQGKREGLSSTERAQLKELQAKYSKKGFYVVGVNVDNDRKDVVAFLSKNRLPWYHLYEPGGLEGRLASEMGILTLPTMILIDKSGRVVSRNIHVSELDKELRKLR